MKINYRAIPQAIAAHETFTGNSMSGRYIDGEMYSGQLPNEYRAQWIGACLAASLGTKVYVVFSYHTPIAWHVDGQDVVIPDHRYSTTTSKHQGKARLGFDHPAHNGYYCPTGCVIHP